MQAFAYPDVALHSRKPFSRASYADPELEGVVRRNAVASCTVDTLSTLEGCVYDPEDDDLQGWFKDRNCKRDYKPLKGSVSMREYCMRRIIAGLLPDHTCQHAKIRKRAKYVDSRQGALKSSKAGSLAAITSYRPGGSYAV